VSDLADRTFTHLPPAAAGLGGLFARPKVIAALCIVALAGLGWAYLGILAAAAPVPAGGSWLSSLCRPLAAQSPAGMSAITEFTFVFLMWGAMSLAMMLPSAAPMILTYAEIADTAMRKGEPVVTPFALALGYAAIWIGFSLVAALAQIALARTGLLASEQAAIGFSAALFVVAGLYQFSSLKQSCLSACQRPFPFFFANWKSTPRGVFGLGLRQGMHCLGCCWAMMALMLGVGAMNPLWMAGLGLVMTAEKMTATRKLSHAIGVILIAAGLAAAALQWFGLPVPAWPLVGVRS